ncbi:Pimeloyl-ACP methyl ester carboxylesterase [Lentzea albidocapillata subsp. violacea]|uniref:Pimeloyl-ACP methyl ester carboxylesterase n=1 Tax=Lentzea albidocapillata subsp. violacea TaxID=128104 RepID=A0A1G9Q9C8_9PSEU|nr:alpha/beta hydrolase [Lentzea albidocapillata]SDM07543.1 Pimeloyl-ACP methyl ester carboxylesterase [Lentzea albidocapillata subsp. violacea]
MRFRRLCAIALLATGTLLAPPPASAATSCQDVAYPVRIGLTPLVTTQETMAGRLCVPTGAKTVQVLIPGGTYDRTYWDVGFEPSTHSFTQAQNKAGFATLALDRLGTGRSSKPLSVLITASTQASAVHQVITTLKPRFTKVIVAGHSIGSAMAMIEAGTHRDVDGVLVTGFTHKMNYVTVVPVLANMIPASLDLGYLTTMPDTRYNSFHKPGPLIPGAISFDEATKDVFAVTEAVDTILLNTVVIPISRRINVPVLIVVGNDTHFCSSGIPLMGSDCSSPAALKADEAPFYPAAPRLDTYVLNGYGHSINYAPNAPDYHAAVAQWSKGI